VSSIRGATASCATTCKWNFTPVPPDHTTLTVRQIDYLVDIFKGPLVDELMAPLVGKLVGRLESGAVRRPLRNRYWPSRLMTPITSESIAVSVETLPASPQGANSSGRFAPLGSNVKPNTSRSRLDIKRKTCISFMWTACFERFRYATP
jgi:hypothetical protein